VWWAGIACLKKQDEIDEIYGTIAAVIPSRDWDYKLHKFPKDQRYWEMGPEGQRIQKTGELLYEGPPADIKLIMTLMENDDEGEAEHFKDLLAGAVDGAVKIFVPGEGARAEAQDDDWAKALGKKLRDVINDILGNGDDGYTNHQMSIHLGGSN
jgi:hypothetical protein